MGPGAIEPKWSARSTALTKRWALLNAPVVTQAIAVALPFVNALASAIPYVGLLTLAPLPILAAADYMRNMRNFGRDLKEGQQAQVAAAQKELDGLGAQLQALNQEKLKLLAEQPMPTEF